MFPELTVNVPPPFLAMGIETRINSKPEQNHWHSDSLHNIAEEL